MRQIIMLCPNQEAEREGSGLPAQWIAGIKRVAACLTSPVAVDFGKLFYSTPVF
jgi:hypothetical protein